jgi:hypothetical protein
MVLEGFNDEKYVHVYRSNVPSASYKPGWTRLDFCEACFWKKFNQIRLKCDDRQIEYTAKYLRRARLFEAGPKAHASLASQP